MGRNSSRPTFPLVSLLLAASIVGLTPNHISALPSSNCSSSTVDDWGKTEAAKARSFLAALKSVALAENKTKLSTMIAYPLNVFAANGKRVIHNRTEFIEKYPSIFTPSIKQAIFEQSSDCLFGNWQGAMVGDGEIWFAEQPNRVFKIITVNLGTK